MAKIFAVSNHKGGVGKTTSTINIGAALTSLGKKVLLIDLDPQCNLTQSLGIRNPELTIYDYFKGNENISTTEIKRNLFVIPSSLDLSVIEMEIGAEPGREQILKEIIGRVSHRFDYVIIDCPPSLGVLTINALTAADSVLIPLSAEILPLRGLARLNDVISKIHKRLNPNLQIGCVFMTRFDQRKILNREIAEKVKEFFGDKVLDNVISENVALAEAPGKGMDIFLYNNKSKGASDYLDICKEMLERKVA